MILISRMLHLPAVRMLQKVVRLKALMTIRSIRVVYLESIFLQIQRLSLGPLKVAQVVTAIGAIALRPIPFCTFRMRETLGRFMLVPMQNYLSAIILRLIPVSFMLIMER